MTRKCPFHGCQRLIDPTIFACKDHWSKMTEKDRKEIWRLWHDYNRSQIRIEDLLAGQKKVMLNYQSAEAPTATHDATAIQLARSVLIYVRKRKEYTATKDQMLDAKKRVGMELSRIEADLVKQANAIVHPKQIQPTLFDAIDKSEGQLPD